MMSDETPGACDFDKQPATLDECRSAAVLHAQFKNLCTHVVLKAMEFGITREAFDHYVDRAWEYMGQVVDLETARNRRIIGDQRATAAPGGDQPRGERT